MRAVDPTADVHSYWYVGRRAFDEIERVGATLRFGQGEEVRLVVPFPGPTPAGEARWEKYRREYTEVAEALKEKTPEFYEGQWLLTYSGKQAVLDGVRSDGSRQDVKRSDLASVMRALEEICSVPGRIKVSELCDLEK
jgi:hypothetical protein